MDRISYTLKHPIELAVFGGKTTRITSVTLASRIKGKHIRATDGAEGPAGRKLLLIGALAGLTPEETDEIDQDDLEALDRLLENGGADPLDAGDAGLAGGPTTGPLSSMP